MKFAIHKWHIIMRLNMKAGTEVEFVCLWPKKDDPNSGLPDWFFEDTIVSPDTGEFYDNFECDLSTDTVEWIPQIGPAPCWKSKLSQYESFEALYADFYKWLEVTY